MRNFLVVALLLSPSLITASALANTPTPDSTNATKGYAVTTGIEAPQVLDLASVDIPAGISQSSLVGAKVTVAFQVDKDGHANNIRVVSTTNAELDTPVVRAIERSRIAPGKLDNTAVPVDMNLTVTVKR